MSYILEKKAEAERLESQSKQGPYNYKDDLRDFQISKNAVILDAGCGSGVVSRHLASSFPSAQVHACDFSQQRLEQAREFAKGISNIQFSVQDLRELTHSNATFDRIVCRYVLEHQSEADLERTMKEFFRVLKPGGSLWVIDVDGFMSNLYPMPTAVEEGLAAMRSEGSVDVSIGRKLPHVFGKAGFQDVSWRIETWNFQGESMKEEIEMMRQRFENGVEYFSRAIGGSDKAKQFEKAFLEAMKAPDAVLFYNKFIVTGRKPNVRLVRS